VGDRESLLSQGQGCLGTVHKVAETKDLDENTLLDLDKNRQICAITIEHASERAEIPKFSYEQITP
jgi:uncharacterized protein YuzE